jgi:hypothetical protein
MAWSNRLGHYSIACDITEPSNERATLTVIENGLELHRRTLTIDAGEDQQLFWARIWREVWSLQDQFRVRVQDALHQEWARQAREGHH